MDDLTLDLALELFQLPRTLGNWEDGYPIKVAVGRFGPYVQYGAKKYASLKKEDDPYTVTLERALRDHPRKADDRGEPDHPGIRRRRRPGAERPLRPVHHRRQEERQDPEGSRSEFADARGVPGAARRGAGARHESLGSQDGREDHGQDGDGEAATDAPKKPRRRRRRLPPKKKAAPKKKARREEDSLIATSPACGRGRAARVRAHAHRPLSHPHVSRHTIDVRRHRVPARPARPHHDRPAAGRRRRDVPPRHAGSDRKAAAANRACCAKARCSSRPASISRT